MQEEDEPAGQRIGRSLEEQPEIGDPALEAMEDRVLERPAVWKLAGGLLVALLIVGSALFGWVMRSQISRLPRLSPAQVRELSEALRAASKLPPHRRRATVGRALANIERDRLPGPLVRALSEGGSQVEHTRLAGLRRALVHPEVRSTWPALCPADLDLEALGAAERSGLRVYEACGLHNMKLLSASHVVSSHASEVLAAHAIFRHLRDHDALTDIEQRALSALARGTVRATPALPFR